MRVFIAAVVCFALLTSRSLSLRGAEEGTTVASCATRKGSILRREKPEAPWHYVDEKEKLKPGELLVGLPGAALDSRDRSVRLTFLTDFGESTFPVLECAVVLHDTQGVDLDVTLDRGRADFTNTREKGAATVRVRVHDQVFDLTLHEPRTRVSLELYGRWPAGTRFKAKPGAEDVPGANLVLLVLHGSANVKHGATVFRMAAPPGAALIQWDNRSGLDATPDKLAELPPWATLKAADTPKARRIQKLAARYYDLVKTKTLDEILENFLASDDVDFRRAFVVLCGAFDRFDLLAPALRQPKHGDLWDEGIRVLRHWIGRGPGQDQKLYAKLLESKLYKPVEAETVLYLLHGFSEDDRARPETYEALIDYLEDERVLVRALARWHLVRLAPQGQEFGYDAAADKKEREEAIKRWRKLIPTGKLPPKKDN